MDQHCVCAYNLLTSQSIGAAGIVFGLPILVYTTVFLCNDVSGCPAPALLDPKTFTLDKLRKQTPWPEDGLMGLFDLNVTLWVLAYYALSLALQLFLPGEEVEGLTLGTGGRHHYKVQRLQLGCPYSRRSCCRDFRPRHRLCGLELHLGQAASNCHGDDPSLVCPGNLRLPSFLLGSSSRSAKF